MIGRTTIVGATFLMMAALLAPAGPLNAQQYVVDDAALVDWRSCHVEAWHGRRASWILPACQPLRNLELAFGAGFIDTGEERIRETEYAIEAKTLFRPLAPNDWGVGFVLGVGPNPSAVPEARRIGDIYAFFPASVSLRDDRWVLHGNVGWEWGRGAPPLSGCRRRRGRELGRANGTGPSRGGIHGRGSGGLRADLLRTHLLKRVEEATHGPGTYILIV